MEIQHDLGLNTRIKVEAFRDAWLQILWNSRWADLVDIRNVFLQENAMLVPLYALQYEAVLKDKQFQVETRMAGKELGEPSLETIKHRLDVIGISYENLIEMARGKEPKTLLFHDRYWKGHVEDQPENPDIPELVKLLFDEKLQELYEPEGEMLKQLTLDEMEQTGRLDRVTNWTIAVSIRIDRLFTNKETVASLNISCYDLVKIGGDHWVYCWPLNTSEMITLTEELQSYSETLTEIIFGPRSEDESQPQRDRRTLNYTDSSQDIKAKEWLAVDHATLSEDGVQWKLPLVPESAAEKPEKPEG